MTDKEELTKLIAAQRADMRLGNRVYYERGVVVSLDEPIKNWDKTIGDLFDQDGKGVGKVLGTYAGCPVHGLTELRERPDGKGTQCNACRRDRYTPHPRSYGPQCGHDPENFRQHTNGRTRCNACRWNANNPAKEPR